MIVVNKNREIIFFSKSAEEMTGWKSKDAIGRHTSELVDIEDEDGNLVPAANRPIHLALSTHKKVATTTIKIYYLVLKDGRKFPATMTATPVVHNNKTIGAILIFRDVTKEKEIDQAKSEFISLASHQLKTPPSAIKLLAERLLGDKIGELTEKQKEYVNDIRSSNQRMIDLVTTLLNVSRIELGAFAIKVEQKDPCKIIESVLLELKPIIDKKSLTLKTIFLQNELSLMLDESLFRMVINNLIVNAVHYTPAEGEISIECQSIQKGQTLGGKTLEENSFVVLVSDNGYGIPLAEQGKIFTKLFRADNAKERETDGSGLGLYIVKSILDNSGGSVWFTSKENQGSTFYVALPLGGMKEKEKKEIINKLV